MKKNLVVIHMESLSNQILFQEMDNLKYFMKMKSESIDFPNFMSSASSSIMAFTDFFYGNDWELDLTTNFENDFKIAKKEKNLFTILDSEGYYAKGIAYPKPWKDEVNTYGIWDVPNNPYDYSSLNEEEFYRNILNAMEDAKNQKLPLALHVWDIRSHLYYTDDLKEKGKNFFERRSLGYQSIDRTFKNVVTFLEELDMLDNTIIVAYGDHGDEFWSHSLNGGFCHSIEPYSTLVHTPCFIYDRTTKSSVNSNLVSLIDLKWIILDLLNINYIKKFDDIGCNALQMEREFVFSRNLLANQTAKYNGVLRKAYSVTNKDYHLMISPLGLEFYMYKVDPHNTFNLLSFLAIDNNGEILDFDNRGAWHTHFRNVMRNDQVENLKENFKILYKELLNYVNKKNQNVIDNKGINILKNINFRKIKEQGNYQWNA